VRVKAAPNLVSGVALVGLSALLYFFAADRSLQSSDRKVIVFVVSPPSLVHRIEWRHSVGFWLALASLTLALGAMALLVSWRFPSRFARPS
jgi:hypothetical protein